MLAKVPNPEPRRLWWDQRVCQTGRAIGIVGIVVIVVIEQPRDQVVDLLVDLLAERLEGNDAAPVACNNVTPSPGTRNLQASSCWATALRTCPHRICLLAG